MLRQFSSEVVISPAGEMSQSNETHDLEQALRERLIALLRTFPSLEATKVTWTRSEVGFSSDPGFKLSLLVGEREGKPWLLRVIVKAQAEPRQVRTAVWSLKKSFQSGGYLDLLRAGLRGDEAAAELRKSPDFSGGWT